jgi:hypothetical protein
MYKRLIGLSSAILGLALVAACHEHKTVQVAPPQQSAQAEPVQPESGGPAENERATNMPPGGSSSVGERGGACPTAVAGTKVNMVDVAGGVALDFTSKANVASLREKVHQLAQAPGATPGSSMGASMNEENAGGADMNAGAMEPREDGVHVPAQASVEDLPDGARLILTPQDANQLPSLRAQTEAQLPQLDQGDCSGLAISNAQARTPEREKANRVPPPSADDQKPIAPDPDESGAEPDPTPQPQPEPQPESPQP